MRTLPGHIAAQFLLMAVTGCAQTTVNIRAQTLVQPVPELVASTNYSLGAPRSASVGTAMVAVKRYSVTRNRGTTVSAPTPFHVGSSYLLSGWSADLSGAANTPYPVVGYALFYKIEYAVVQIDLGQERLLVDSTGLPLRQLLAGNDLVGRAHFEPESLRFSFSTTPSVVRSAAYENYELLYSGTDGSSFHVTYREYSPDDLIRPAFSQDLIYSKQSTTIRFRELQIAVQSATSEQIAFTVLSDGH